MKVLFIHPNFPAQFRHLAFALGQHPHNQVLFLTKNENPEWNLAGVKKVLYKPSREPSAQTHHYIRHLEKSILEGQAAFRALDKLKAQGFIPDLVYGHSGWGGTLFARDAFPHTPMMCYFEWFYNAHGSDADFDPGEPLSLDDLLRIRMKNNSILTDLYSCQQGLSPTKWQQSQFPVEYHDKIKVLHDGVDIDYFKPNPGAKLLLPNLDLSEVKELVTYVARGMEPYRGFPQLIEAIAHIQKRRPKCHVAIVGADRVAYGKSLPGGKSYKEFMLAKIPLDLARVHFTGSLPYAQYLKVIQASDVHIYLTRPFVLSWSMLEAMSAGCLVLGSDTEPVKELIKDGENGLLVDFFSPEKIARRVDEVFEHPNRMQELRDNARQTIIERYALKQLVPQHLQLMADLAKCPLNYGKISIFTQPTPMAPSSTTEAAANSILWFTGLSGSGKTTLARSVATKLRGQGYRVAVIDEDDVREYLNPDGSYEPAMMGRSARQVAFLAQKLSHNGIAVLVAAASNPNYLDREEREKLNPILEIHLKASLEVCQARDPHQLYARAREGKIDYLEGINRESQLPAEPSLICFTDRETVEDSTAKIFRQLTNHQRSVPLTTYH